ncbi:KDEL motif-containing protein 1 [Porphyridium purpureum]|uniref:KDEL motif-containing protein 1 n=1 Tax=Porphyridium purpureum TaxID=35688 RepID=A0A5J4Z4U7_PORPP|nr:KDEL motif-containing protein 1 [Porphyridium purpureum]|eukprot:POR4314..scf295_1
MPRRYIGSPKVAGPVTRAPTREDVRRVYRSGLLGGLVVLILPVILFLVGCSYSVSMIKVADHAMEAATMEMRTSVSDQGGNGLPQAVLRSIQSEAAPSSISSSTAITSRGSSSGSVSSKGHGMDEDVLRLARSNGGEKSDVSDRSSSVASSGTSSGQNIGEAVLRPIIQGVDTSGKNPASSKRNMAFPSSVPVWKPWSAKERKERFQGILSDFFSEATGFSEAEQARAREDSSMATNAMLVQIDTNNNVRYLHSWESAENRHSRYLSFVGLMDGLRSRHKLPKVSFNVVLNDGTNAKQAAFSAARHTQSWTRVIPFPVGNSRGLKEGFGLNFTGWDDYAKDWYASKYKQYPWDDKLEQAVFRGNFPMSELAQVIGTCYIQCQKTRDWKLTSRGTLYMVTANRSDLFDVQFTSKPKGMTQIDDVPVNPSAKIPLHELMKYKYVLNVGANSDWAERLRNLLFLNSVILRHEVGTQEWFYPLLEPFVHYIPFHASMDNLVDVVVWAQTHDDLAHQIAQNANAFARTVLSEAAMLEYAKLAIDIFAAKQLAAS